MKKITINILLILVSFIVYSQEEILSTDFIKSYGKELNEKPIGIENDNTGYYSVIASKSNNIFDIDSIPNDSIERSYLVKYDFNGNIINIAQIENLDSTIVSSLTLKNNKLYIVFIKKEVSKTIAQIKEYDTNFNLLLSDTLYTTPTINDNNTGTYVSQIIINTNNDIIIKGFSYDTIVVQNDTLGNTISNFAGGYEYGFLIQYSDNYDLNWTFEFADNITNIDYDENNNIYFNMVTNITNVLNHDTIPNNFIETQRGYIVYGKINSQGELIWHKEIGRLYGSNNDIVNIYSSKMIYSEKFGLLLSGEHQGCLDFADSSIYDYDLCGSFYFASIDTANGHLINNFYLKDQCQFEHYPNITITDILVSDNSLYFLGDFSTIATPESFTFGNATLTSKNDSNRFNNNIFILKFDTAYNPITAFSINSDIGEWYYLDKTSCNISNNNIMITGYFEQDCYTYDSLNFSSNGHRDVFLISIKNDIQQSISEIEDNVFYKIYPNPTKGKITIETENIIQIDIYNSNGVLIKTTNTNTVNIEDKAKGIYYIKIISQMGSNVKKIILE